MGRVAVAGIFIVAAASFAARAGSVFANDAAWLFRLLALGVLGTVIVLAVWLYHRRRSHELIVARYHLKGDALGWRKLKLTAMGQDVRVCAECGALVPDYYSQEEHAGWHEDLAALIAGRGEVESGPVSWSAVTEDATEVPAEPAPELDRRGQWADIKDLIKSTTGR